MFPMYLDDDSERVALVAALRRAGIDVVRSTDAGMRGSDDAAHLEFATAQGRVLYSANRRDFAALHARLLANGRTHAGMILVTDQRIPVGQQIRRIIELQTSRDASQMQNVLEWLTRARHDPHA
jgi:hypothetical protein